MSYKFSYNFKQRTLLCCLRAWLLNCAKYRLLKWTISAFRITDYITKIILVDFISVIFTVQL